MLKTIIAASTIGLSIAVVSLVFAQAGHEKPHPADINPVSLSRLPPLTRADLDAEGQAVYDRIVGDNPPPKTGPVAVTLYSPKVAQAFSDLNGYLRYNGDLSPRHTEVAILVAAWEIEQQYEYSAHEPAALRYGAPQAVIDTIKYDREPKGLSPEETLDHQIRPPDHARAQARLRAVRRSGRAFRQKRHRGARNRDGRLRHGRHRAHGHRPAVAPGSARVTARAIGAIRSIRRRSPPQCRGGCARAPSPRPVSRRAAPTLLH